MLNKNLYPFFLFFSFIIYTCDSPAEFTPDNPFDPENPDFVDPETSILTGPAEGETVDTSSVTITWEGNEQAIEYSYSLNNDWKEWISETSVTLDYLDEGDYFFQVKSRYASQYEEHTPAEVNFIIDAVQGPAIRIYPLLAKTTVSQAKIVEVYMEEVENIMATEFSVSYNPLLVNVDSVAKGAMLEGFFGDSVLIFIHETHEESDNAIITFNLGVALGDDAGISGSGSVAVIKFMPVSIGNFDIEISTESTFRDYNNIVIPINQIVNGKFAIE